MIDSTFILLLLGAVFGLPLIFLIAALANRKNHPDRAKVFFILLGVYVLIAGGICGSMFV